MSKKLPRLTVYCETCGTSMEVTQSRLDNNRGRFCSRSCNAKTTSARHGHCGKTWHSPTYSSWAGMIQRCTNPKHPKFQIYGARGITVEARWLSFDEFLADMGERPKGKTIDRKDNDAGYSAENCRWATPKVQQNNQSRTRIVSYEGRDIPLSDLAEKLGMNKATLFYRIQAGWPEERWAKKAWGGSRGS